MLGRGNNRGSVFTIVFVFCIVAAFAAALFSFLTSGGINAKAGEGVEVLDAQIYEKSINFYVNLAGESVIGQNNFKEGFQKELASFDFKNSVQEVNYWFDNPGYWQSLRDFQDKIKRDEFEIENIKGKVCIKIPNVEVNALVSGNMAFNYTFNVEECF